MHAPGRTVHTSTHAEKKSIYQNTQVYALQSERPNMLLTNLLVTVLQSPEIKWGDQSQLAVRVKWREAKEHAAVQQGL